LVGTGHISDPSSDSTEAFSFYPESIDGFPNKTLKVYIFQAQDNFAILFRTGGVKIYRFLGWSQNHTVSFSGWGKILTFSGWGTTTLVKHNTRCYLIQTALNTRF